MFTESAQEYGVSMCFGVQRLLEIASRPISVGAGSFFLPNDEKVGQKCVSGREKLLHGMRKIGHFEWDTPQHSG